MPYLYAVQMIIFGYPFHPIKIGMSANPEVRARTYNSGPFPCQWLGAWEVENACVEERLIHRRYEAFRLAGEWFYPSRGLLRFIEARIGLPIEAALLSAPTRERDAFNQRFLRLFPDGLQSISKEWERPGKAKPCGDKAFNEARAILDAIEQENPINVALRAKEQAAYQSLDV